MRSTVTAVLLIAGALRASENHPVPAFTDPQRSSKLASAFPKIDSLFERYATERAVPGMVWGVVIDGALVHTGATGVGDRSTNTPVTPATVFRIASMTKSFTVLAILKLRDEGKLSLEDPVSRWIPEFARMPLPTADSGPLRVRHLLTHSAGFPEDNPWGDQQLGVSDAELTSWLNRGIPFSTPPGTEYEYSNYGFGLLGRIVSKASGTGYREYLEKQILAPLRMTSSSLEPTAVSSAVRATGYRRLPDGSYEEEKPLSHGGFGSMGGLLTSANDLARYVAFQLSAWPPRDDPEAGPVRRASVREMNHLWQISNLSAGRGPAGRIRAEVSGYGYGLRISADCRFRQMTGHGGGLPGFGSYMAWLPEHGVGLFAMANLTYAGPGRVIGDAFDALLETGGLKARELSPSAVLMETRDAIVRLWRHWDEGAARKLAAMNLFLDRPAEQRRNEIEKLKAELGECTSPGPVVPENWLRGSFDMKCTNGSLGVFFSLAPTQPPAVQFLAFRVRKAGDPPLTAPTSGRNGVACSE